MKQRKDYVTDNLVYIRDHLRANCRPAAPAESAPEAPAEAPAPAPQPADDAKAREAALRRERAGWKRLTEATQAKRDLAARLNRDLAEMETELRLDEEVFARKRRIRDDLTVQLDELLRLDPESAGDAFPQSVENLRLEYFRSVGQRTALDRETDAPAGAPAETARRSDLYLAALIAAGGMTLAGIIIAIAIAAVFR